MNNFFLILLKIKDNRRKLKILQEDIIVDNFSELVDLLRILTKNFSKKKYVIKGGCLR
jgi:hypothetical protein